MKPKLLEIISNDILFCMVNPDLQMRKVSDLVGDLLKRYKQLKMNIKNAEELKNTEIVRNLAIGISAGSLDLVDYDHWIVKA